MAQEILQASFSRNGKIAKFYVSTVTTDFGRRGKLHQSPFNDTPFFEDLGRRGRSFTAECYVMPVLDGITNIHDRELKLAVDDDKNASYEDLRNNLIDVIEGGSGTGLFVHPTMGELNAVPTKCSTKFDNKVGRIETFSITFVEEGKRWSTTKDTRQAILLELDSYKSRVIPHFGNNYTINYKNLLYGDNNVPYGPLSDGSIGGLVKTLDDYLKKFDKLSKITKVTSEISDFSKDFLELSNKLQAFPQLVVGSITEVFNAVQRIMTGFAIVTQNPLDRLKSALSLFGSLFSESKSKTAKYNSLKGGNKYSQSFRAAQSENAMSDLMLFTAIEEIGNSALDSVFTDKGQLTFYKEEINKAFSDIIIKVGDSDDSSVYESLLALQSSINEDLNNRIEQLPEVKVIFNGKVRPALVIAYNQHEDSEKAVNLVGRNSISNPNSVSIRDLEVLI
tara:strand:- start:1644 stop:2990 length:1347 start_codon:yes stop_codon:yes gene_type:complete